MEEILRLSLKFAILLARSWFPVFSCTCEWNKRHEAKTEERKIYVRVDQVTLTEDGIIVLLDNGEDIVASTLGHDAQGLYVKSWKVECPYHDLDCGHCYGCYPTNRCAFRCKCRHASFNSSEVKIP